MSAAAGADRELRIFAVTLHRRPGAIDRVLGAVRRQGCTVASLTFGQTAHPAVDRLTLTFIGGDPRRLHGQLTRTVDVIAVLDLSAISEPTPTPVPTLFTRTEH